MTNRSTNKPFLIASKSAGEWGKKADALLTEDVARHNRKPITGKLWMKALFFGAWKEESKTMPDLSNLYQAVEDALQRNGVIEDESKPDPRPTRSEARA